MDKEYNLQRFLYAQEKMYTTALSEIKNGGKESHWIWYIFPQLKGLGHSFNSNYYGLDGLGEAIAYYHNPILRQRLVAVFQALYSHKTKTVFDIMPDIDVRKILSCATAFEFISDEKNFKDAIDLINLGDPDERTIKLIEEDKITIYGCIKEEIVKIYSNSRLLCDEYFNSLEDFDNIYREMQRERANWLKIRKINPFDVSDICWPAQGTYFLIERFEVDGNEVGVGVSAFWSGPPDYVVIDLKSVPLDILMRIVSRLKSYIERSNNNESE